MLIVVQSAFAAAAWGSCSADVLTRFGLVAAAGWTTARVVGVGSTFLPAPVVTLVMLGVTLSIRATEAAGLPEWLVSGPFSVPVLTSLLAVVLLLDVLEVAERHGERLAAVVRRNGLSILCYGLVSWVVISAVVVPLAQELIAVQNAPADKSHAMDRLTLSENMLFKLVESVTGIWFLVAGTVVGSFLNVVIHRVPRGLSVIAQPSHCPACRTRIPAADNVPLVGWLRLNGRCRNCDVAIAVRYPLIEGVVGTVFLLLFFVELISGGTNLPVRNPNFYAGVQWILFYTKWDLVGLYAYHCVLLCILFSWAMILRDGHKVPFRAAAVMLAFIIFAPLLQPHLLPWPFNSDGTHAVIYTVRDAALTSLLGMLAAVLVTTLPAISKTVWGSPRQPLPQFHLPSWLIIGAGLGWQAVVGVFVLMIAWTIGCLIVAPADETAERDSSAELRPLCPAADLRRLALPAVVLVHLCLWRQIPSLLP